MKTQRKIGLLLTMTALLMLVILIMQPLSILQFREKIAFLFPKGSIAVQQRDLLLIIQAIMLIVIIPVYILTFYFSWHYRAYKKEGKYDPDLVDSVLAEVFWWGIPCILTFAIAFITWQKTYELDPYKPLVSDKKPLTIQVVALQWKWLFLYPEEQIASLNFLQFPAHTPLHFEITADAPMNSFWIPQLGGQIYAMPKMRTELNLIADAEGDFRGSSAQLSGKGFAGMHFIARASSDEAYKKWVDEAKNSSNLLDKKSYEAIAAPSEEVPPTLYQLKEDALFMHIIHKYLKPHKAV